MLNEFLMVLLCQFLHILRDRLLADILAQIVIIDIGFHLDQVDDTLEGILRADRQLDRNGIALQTVLHHAHNIIEVCAHDVHFVDIRHTRNLVFVRLTPNRLGLGLHAALGAEHRHRAVQHAQRTLHFNGEVHVTGSVNDVDAVLFPETGGRSGGDGNTTLLLLLHPVHGRSAVMRFTDLVVDTGVVQNTLGGGRLTGIDVCHDADVSGFFK